jgi:thiol:disulfide interchange protein DsbD
MSRSRWVPLAQQPLLTKDKELMAFKKQDCAPGAAGAKGHRFPLAVGIPSLALLTLLAPATAFAEDGGSASNAFTAALARGPFFAVAAAFVGGLLVSLTPCVYPMIAITVSVFGAKQSKSRLHAAGLSSVFVLGIAVMFTALGVGAALSGAIFGKFLSNPYIVGGLAVVFLAMAASMFGAFEMALPASLNNRLATVGGIGLGGAFVLGLVSALVAAPCTGPVLTGILVWIATSHRVVLGTGVMFTFACGLGVPFFLVGTFAVSLPKGGSWMLGVKWIFGVVLAVVALYFLRNVLGPLQHLARPGNAFGVISGGLLATSVVLAWLHVASEKRGAKHPERSKPFKFASIPLAIVGAFLTLSWVELPKAQLQWLTSEAEGAKIATKEHRPLIVDFGAEWCGACKELTTHTFADDTVRSEAGRFIAVRVDATDDDDPQVNAIKDKYKVVGLPTVVVMDSTGQERVRFNEFVPPERFLSAIRAVN